MKTIIEFYIFELIEALNYSLNKEFWVMEKISKKEDSSGRKQDK